MCRERSVPSLLGVGLRVVLSPIIERDRVPFTTMEIGKTKEKTKENRKRMEKRKENKKS